MTPQRSPLLIGVILAGIGALLAGCSSDPTSGYSLNAAHDRSIETVAVPIFQNDTFHTGVEQTLTRDLIRQIQIQTPWRVTSPESADALLQGTITDVTLRSLSTRTGVGFVQEMAVQLTVEFEFIDNRSGETLTARTNYTALGGFVPANPTGERLEIGYAGATQELATDLVGDLQNAW